MHSEIAGSLGRLSIRGDFAHASLHATGNAGGITIGGDLLGGTDTSSGSIHIDGKLGSFTLGGSLSAAGGAGSGLVESGILIGKTVVKGSIQAGASIVSGGSLGPVIIRGDLAGLDATHPASLTAGRGIASLTVGGSVTDADVLAGFSKTLQPVNPDATIGAVKVANNWIASNLVAGIGAGADGLFGTSDDTAATAAAPNSDNALLLSRIASIQVGGYVAGSAANATDRFAFTAQRIGKLSIGASVFALNPTTPDVLALGLTGDVTLAEVSA